MRFLVPSSSRPFFLIIFCLCASSYFAVPISTASDPHSIIELSDNCIEVPMLRDFNHYFTGELLEGELGECNEEGCPPCPPIYVLSINGINATVDSAFHDWVEDNTPPGIRHRHDPYNGGSEFCNSRPSQAAEKLRKTLERFKAENPCARVMIIGHSLGGTAAWDLRDISDCSIYIDPPTKCHFGGPLFCPSQRDICRSIDEGIKDDEGYIPTDEHTPFNDPEAHCADLQRIREAIDSCVQRLRPNCPENIPTGPAPSCDVTPPTPTPVPTPWDNGCYIEDSDGTAPGKESGELINETCGNVGVY